jgi:hypothetical protein
MMVFVVHNPKTEQVWVFSKHEDALRWRRDQKLNHWHLWGTTVDCVINDKKI